MASRVALLRGVNVGGVRVAMANLRDAGRRLGWTDVRTHLNSGNVLFTSDEAPDAAAERLRGALAANLGVDVPVLVRTPAELAAAIERNPFRGAPYEQRKVQVAFLATPLHPDAAAGIAAPGREEVVVAGREAYLHYPEGLGRSKLDLAALERSLGVTATMRGIRTVAGLLERC